MGMIWTCLGLVVMVWFVLDWAWWGVAQRANRVAFCMASFLYFYTNIVQGISNFTITFLDGPITFPSQLLELINSISLAHRDVKTQSRNFTRFISNSVHPHQGFSRIQSLPSVVKIGEV